MPHTYKPLAQVNPSAATLTDAYTVPAATQTVVSRIFIANRSATATAFRVSVAIAGAGDNNAQYISYDTPIAGNDSIEVGHGLTLQPTDKIRVYATLATLSFGIFGDEIT